MARRLAALALVAPLAACQGSATPQGVPVQTVAGNAGLGANVEVLYDGLGMPHIYAGSDEDGAYALGYVHARDRLFQMDFYRRAGRGRLSELFGSATLPQDVFLRTVFTGIRTVPPTPPATSPTYDIGRVEDLIAADLQNTAPQVYAVAQRYADGVNRYIQDALTGQNGARLPVEYVLVTGTVPVPAQWTVQDSIALGRLFSFQLSFDLDVGVGQAAQALGCTSPASPPYQCAVFGDLTRSAPAVASIILPPSAPPPVALQAGVASSAVPAASLQGAAAAAASVAGLFGPEKAGSNNWVVSGSRTASGVPLLANDPHLAYENPSIFYLVQLSTPTRDVAGVSFPGAPIVEIGHNGKVAWGDTVVGYDVTDTFVEMLQTAGVPSAVFHGGAFQPIPPPLNESFGVRGGMTGCPAPCTVTVPIPVVPWHGPILPGSISGTTALSVQWTGQQPTEEVLAFWNLNGAATVDEAFAALQQFAVGAQNFVLADNAGHIGYDPHALVPIRPAGCLPWAPMRGDGPCDWTGYIADADLPQAKSPAVSWVATANNDVTGTTVGTSLGNPPLGPPYLYYTTDLGYRHARIAGRLTEKTGGYTLDDMTSIQADVHSLFAEALVPALLSWWSSSGCSTVGNSNCATAIADRELATGLKLTEAVTLFTAWAAAGPQQFRTPTGLATANPAGPPSADTSELQAAAASMLFHALVPRLARRILDDDLARYGYSVDSWLDSQLLAKYLVALGGYAPGRTPPTVPLGTEAMGASLCRVWDPGTSTFGAQTCADMAVLALQDAVTFLTAQPELGPSPQDWLWGRLHRVFFRSHLSPATTLLDYGPFAKHGGLHTVDVGNFSWSDDGPGGFVEGSGANVRFSVELGSSSLRWRAVIPGGQSGFAGDLNYMDQVPAYLANQPGDQPYTPGEVLAAARRSLTFMP